VTRNSRVRLTGTAMLAASKLIHLNVGHNNLSSLPDDVSRDVVLVSLPVFVEVGFVTVAVECMRAPGSVVGGR
jgi:hypothetical protein